MSELPRPPRRYLGRVQSISERVRTYWTDEALEVDQVDNLEIRRRRVFFDEIQLVTLHTTRGMAIALLPFCLSLISMLSAMIAGDDPSVSRFFWAAGGILVAVAAGLGLAPVWVVTVFGKRTRARMHFPMRQGKARAVYAEITRAASEAQRALSLRLAEQFPEASPPSPPPLPPLPLSDEDLPLPPAEEPPPSPQGEERRFEE